MIDETKTFEKFGYYSSDWAPKSHKKIVAVCNNCGKERLLKIQDYRKLCFSCGKIGERNPQYGKIGKNNPLFGKHRTEETKNKISKSKLGIPISEEHKDKLRGKRPHLSGKNNPKWDHSKTDEERLQKRAYPEYHNWRLAVYERDNYTCKLCGNNKGGNLNSHHIDSYASNPDKRTLLENGVTLCNSCHKNFHHRYGYGNNTKEQFIEFISNYNNSGELISVL